MGHLKIEYRLTNKTTRESFVYREATYTKLDSMYGYLCMDGMDVKFFWAFDGGICCDDISDKFEIEQIISR